MNAQLAPEAVDDTARMVDAPEPPASKRRGRIRRAFSLLHRWCLVKPFQLASLVILLAIASSLPIIQLISLGYLLEVSARISRSGRLRDGLFLLEQAGTIGLAAGAVFAFSLPVRLLSNWSVAASLVNPESVQPQVLRWLGSLLVVILAAHIGWVWYRGNTHWYSYLRPRPIEFARGISRRDTWLTARDQLWDFAVSLKLEKLFWLGFRGMLGTLLWLLIPGSILVGTLENGNSGIAGLFGFLGLVLMAIVLLYLPYLQVRFATEDRFKALFEVGSVRQQFKAAPMLFTIGLAATYAFSIPLYLLKVEATPQEVTWAPCIVMVAFLLPARIMTGLAYAYGTRREIGRGIGYSLLRGSMRMLCIPIIAGYLLFVFLSGFTSWDGLETWFQQHSLLIPVPFRSGV